MEPASTSTPKPSSDVMLRKGMPRMLGRYELLGALARGGMATVYLARHRGEAGFQRLFAIKVLHEHLSDDDEFVNMMLDEARIAARLHHPNVVPILDLGSQDGLHYLVLEYVEGCSLAVLLKKFRDQRPPRLLIPILLDILAGLHAAHSLKDDDDNPMNLVHRDVSPQNVMVGIDGTARLTDFGIARAESRIMSTRPGQLKGKLAFMSPEQIRGVDRIDCRADLFSAGAMLWSALTGRRLFLADSDAATLSNILQMPIPSASTIGLKPPVGLDPFFARALERDPARRFPSAQEMEETLRDLAMAAACLGSRREVAAWVQAGFGDELEERRRAIKAVADVSRPPIDSMVSSGLIPSVGSFTPSQVTSHSVVGAQISAELPTPDSSTAHSVLAPSQAPTVMQPGIVRKRNQLWVAAAALGMGLLGLVAIGVVVIATRTPEPVAQARPIETAQAVATPAPTPPPAPTPVVKEEPAAPAPAETTTSEPVQSESRWRPTSRWVPPSARKSAKPEPTTKATAETPAPPPPPPPAAPKKPTRWDKDSPGLPPE